MLKFTLNCRLSVFMCAFVLMFFCFGCVGKKAYVGEKCDTTNWPKFVSGEQIVYPTEHALFIFSITKLNEDGEYLLKGTMDGSKGKFKSFDRLLTHKSRFNLLLSKNNVVIDSIAFHPKGTNFSGKTPIERKFKTTPFDSIAVTYYLYVVS